MRADMAKVLVERPRFGSRDPNGPGKSYRRRLARYASAGEDPPAREGMRAGGNRTKCFNEHLAPLRRFLGTHTGRPWAKVYAEIAAHVRPTNVVQKHILTHLFQYVAVSVAEIDGEPCDPATEEPLRSRAWGPMWYVCPRTGLLRAVPRMNRREARQRWQNRPDRRLVRPTQVVSIDDTRQCHRYPDRWEMVTLAPLPTCFNKRVWDVLRKRPVSVGDEATAQQLYGAKVYAVARRPLSRAELRQLPIPIDLLSDRSRSQPDRVRR